MQTQFSGEPEIQNLCKISPFFSVANKNWVLIGLNKACLFMTCTVFKPPVPVKGLSPCPSPSPEECSCFTFQSLRLCSCGHLCLQMSNLAGLLKGSAEFASCRPSLQIYCSMIYCFVWQVWRLFPPLKQPSYCDGWKQTFGLCITVGLPQTTAKGFLGREKLINSCSFHNL